MALTVKQVREMFPDVQFTGGSGIIRVEGKAVDIGRVAANGGFVLSTDGELLVKSVVSDEPVANEEKPVELPEQKPAKAKAQRGVRQSVTHPADTLPDVPAFDDLGD